MIFDGSSVNLFVAFFAGLVSFFAPCVVPLVPAYVGYFAGIAALDGGGDGEKKVKVFSYSLTFVLGFVFIFVILGLTATSIGHLFAVNKTLVARIGGVLMMFLGVYLLDLIKIPALYRERKFAVSKVFSKFQYLNTFLLGVTFGFAWTPCIGPVLAVILFFASQSGSSSYGMLLLLVYGLGIALPFVLISVFIDKIMPFIRKTQRVQMVVHRAAGVLIFLFGLALLTETTGYFRLLFV